MPPSLHALQEKRPFRPLASCRHDLFEGGNGPSAVCQDFAVDRNQVTRWRGKNFFALSIIISMFSEGSDAFV